MGTDLIILIPECASLFRATAEVVTNENLWLESIRFVLSQNSMHVPSTSRLKYLLEDSEMFYFYKIDSVEIRNQDKLFYHLLIRASNVTTGNNN